MRRNGLMLAVLVLLLLALSFTAHGRARPDNYADPASQGEDHTWGGEQGIGDNIIWGDETVTIGVIPFDFLLNRILLERFFIGQESFRQRIDCVVGPTNETRPQQEMMQNRGN